MLDVRRVPWRRRSLVHRYKRCNSRLLPWLPEVTCYCKKTALPSIMMEELSMKDAPITTKPFGMVLWIVPLGVVLSSAIPWRHLTRERNSSLAMATSVSIWLLKSSANSWTHIAPTSKSKRHSSLRALPDSVWAMSVLCHGTRYSRHPMVKHSMFTRWCWRHRRLSTCHCLMKHCEPWKERRSKWVVVCPPNKWRNNQLSYQEVD